MTTTRDRLEQALQDRGITGEAEIDAIISLLAQEPPPARMDYVSLPILATLLHETSNRLEATIDAKFTELRAEFAKELSTLRAESEDRFNKIEARQDNAEARLDGIEDRLDKIEERIDKLADRIDQIVQAMAEMAESAPARHAQPGRSAPARHAQPRGAGDL